MRRVVVCALLLTALDWPKETNGPVAEPPGAPVGLEAVKRKYPQHPGSTSVPYALCTVRVFVDETGRPYHTDSRGCEPPFNRVAEKALSDWRFEPHVVDGQPVPATTKVAVTFMRGPPGSAKAPPKPACDWLLRVAPTGEVSLSDAGPPRPCAGWIVDQVSADVPLTGLGGTCTLSFIRGEPVDDSGCPPGSLAVGVDVLQRSLFGPASRTTVVIDMPPDPTPAP